MKNFDTFLKNKSFSQGMFYLRRAYIMISATVRISKSMKECGEEMEETFTHCPMIFSSMDKHMIYKIQTSCKRLKEENKFAPYKLFGINYAAFLSIVATAMTYIVVMVQFKTSELPLKA